MNYFNICKSNISCGLLLACISFVPTSAYSTSMLSDWMYSNNFKNNIAKKLYRVSPEQRVSRGEKYLKQGLYKKADKHFSILAQNPEYSIFAKYAEALSLTQQGKFNKALTLVQNTLTNQPLSYKEKLEDLEASLLVILAQQSLNNDDVRNASDYLRYFVSRYKSTPYNSTALTLIQKINRKFKPLDKSNIPLKVALLLPTTGDYAEIGQALLKGSQLAIFDSNNKNLLLYPLNTKGTPEGAKKAMEKAVDQGVDIVVGPLLSSSVEAVMPIANTADKILLPFSSDTKVANRYVFLNSFNPQEQARLIARKAVDLGRKSFAALIPNTPYGQRVFRVFQNEISKLTGKKVLYAFYDPEKIDISPQLDMLTNMDEVRAVYNKELNKLKREYKSLGSAMEDDKIAKLKQMQKEKPSPVINFDALFIPAKAENLPLIASQLAYFDIDASDVLLLGTSTWNNKNILKNRGEYLRNSLFPALPYSQDRAVFEQKYLTSYKQNPHILASFAYDSINILSDFYKQYKNNINKLPNYLTKEFGFNGVNGAFRFTAGGVTQHNYDFKKVANNKFKTVIPAQKVMPPYLPANIQEKRAFFNSFSIWD